MKHKIKKFSYLQKFLIACVPSMALAISAQAQDEDFNQELEFNQIPVQANDNNIGQSQNDSLTDDSQHPESSEDVAPDDQRPQRQSSGPKLSAEEQMIANLLQANPFQSNPLAGGSSKDPLQLRGIYQIDGRWSFSVYDVAAKKSYTLRLNQPISENTPYTINSFDDKTGAINISNSLGVYTLVLKEKDDPAAAKAAAVKKQTNNNNNNNKKNNNNQQGKQQNNNNQQQQMQQRHQRPQMGGGGPQRRR